MLRTVPRLATLTSVMLVLGGSPAAAEIRPGETKGLGLMGPAIPSLLKAVVADPYRAPAEPACQSIPQELAALNDVLGPDADEPVEARSKVVSNFVGSAVRRMIPYRSVMRFVTRAGDKDKALTAAWMAGFARRGYLRGLEVNLDCAGRRVATAAGSDAAAVAPDLHPTGPADEVAAPAPVPADPGR